MLTLRPDADAGLFSLDDVSGAYRTSSQNTFVLTSILRDLYLVDEVPHAMVDDSAGSPVSRCPVPSVLD